MYEQHFGLSGAPFQLTPDSRFFFSSAAHSRALAHLSFGLNQAEGFIVVTGEVGAGKTMLVEYLCSRLDPDQFTLAKITTTQLSPDDLVRLVAAEFGIAETRACQSRPAAAPARSHRATVGCRQTSAAGGRTRRRTCPVPALEELRMLSNVRPPGAPPLQSFLLPASRNSARRCIRLRWSSCAQRVLAAFHLGPLERDETRLYVEHRLKTGRLVGASVVRAGLLRRAALHAPAVCRARSTPWRRACCCRPISKSPTHIRAQDVDVVADELALEVGEFGVTPGSDAMAATGRPRRAGPARGADRNRSGPARTNRAPHGRSGRTFCRARTMTVANGLSFDIEEYFHAEALGSVLGDTGSLESRVARTVDTLLSVLAAHDTHATFFVLGAVAARHPQLVRRIAGAGHEVASHGWSHTRVDRLTPAAFDDEIRRSRDLLEAQAGAPVSGFPRAEFFDRTAQTPWAFDLLARAGYRYDSSVYPVRHDLYGDPTARRANRIASRMVRCWKFR